MQKECVASQEEFQSFKTTVGVVKWMCITVIALLALIVAGMTTAVWQNHSLTVEVVLLKDAFNDHLTEQREEYGFFADFFAKQERDDGEKKTKKKTLYARTGDDE